MSYIVRATELKRGNKLVNYAHDLVKRGNALLCCAYDLPFFLPCMSFAGLHTKTINIVKFKVFEYKN